MFKESFKRIFALIKKIIWIIGGLLVILIVADLISAYKILSEINVWLGYGLIFTIIIGVSWIIILLIKTLINKPRIKYPPVSDQNNQVNEKQIKAYNKYLIERHNRLLFNNLDKYYVEKSLRIQNELQIINKSASSYIELIEIKNRIETELFLLTHSYLQSKSDKIIENNVRDIMISVLVSPYRSVDIIIVLIRNLKMYNQLLKLYNVRLGIKRNYYNLIDVFKIVVAVNYINIGEKFIEGVLSEVPFLKKFGGDLAQSIGAGILSNSFGQLAVTRLTALHKWDEESERMKFKKQITSFSETVRNIAKNLKPSSLIKAEKKWNNISPIIGKEKKENK